MSRTADRVRDEVQLFDGLEDEAVRHLNSRLATVTAGKGELIYSPFDPGGAVYVVESGRVRLYRSASDGRQLTLALVDAGMLFGEVAAAGRATYDCYAEALDDCSLRMLRLSDLEVVTVRHPQVALNLLRSVCERLRRAEDQLESIAFHPVGSRLAAQLLELMERYGRVTPAGIRVDRRFTHVQLAEMIGTSRETLTKVINELRAAGAVDVRDRMLWVLDVDRLERLRDSG
ncbi:MAG TPA: Crp/Fnr family transcriptional regulator [Gaiellales bacterium]|nr:Crp/Fnr family transcriptional regulator [Gaiellales bacterium]